MAIDWPTTARDVLNADPLTIKNAKDWHHIHSYGGWGRFFKGLTEKKLLGTACLNAECPEQRLWLPPRCECPDCWHEMDWSEAPQQGTIYTWSIIKYPGAPFKLPQDTPLISIEIEGVCTKLMSWLKEGQPEIGLPVKAVFNTEHPTNTILDLAWVPA